jgi:hypothetical protein
LGSMVVPREAEASRARRSRIEGTAIGERRR